MATLSFRAFVAGRGTWRAHSPWHPLLAVLAAIGVVVLGQLAPIAALAVMTGTMPKAILAGRPGEEQLYQLVEGNGSSLLLLSQSVLGLLTIGAASLYRARFTEVLSLEKPEDGLRAYVFAVLLMIPLVAAIEFAAYKLDRAGFLSDMQQFATLARSVEPVAGFLAIAVGAPLWEEMLFRGFLVAPLSGTMGFWPAAVLVSGAWTALHLGYSLVGLAEVFLIGIYFSWLMWRTGSLWVPIACHALYNGVFYAALRFLPL